MRGRHAARAEGARHIMQDLMSSGFRRILRLLPALALCALTLALVAASLVPDANAQFSATTSNDGNSFGAATVAAPASLTAVQTCVGGGGGGSTTPPSVGTTQNSEWTTSNGNLGSSDGPLVVTKPSNATTNDLLVTGISRRAPDPPTSVPSGWTLIRQESNGAGYSFLMYYHVVTASETGATTWGFQYGTTGNTVVQMTVRVTGADPVSPIEASNSMIDSNPPASGSLTAPGFTPTVSNTLLLGIFGLRDFGTAAASAPLTAIGLGASSGNTAGVHIGYETRTDANAIANRSAAVTGITGADAAGLVAVRPLNSATPSAPVLKAVAHGSVASGTLTLTVPTAAASGDLLLVQIGWIVAAPTANQAGWTAVRATTVGTTVGSTVWARVAGANPGGTNYTFNAAGSANPITGTLSVISNAYVSGTSITGAIENSNTGGGATSSDAGSSLTAPTAPSVNTGSTHDLLLTFYAINNKITSPIATPTGQTQQAYDFNGGGGASGWVSASANSQTLGSGASTGTRAITISSATWVAQNIPIIPPPGTMKATISWTAIGAGGATGFSWERRASQNGAAAVSGTISDGTATQVVDDGPLNGTTTYWYAVRTNLGTWWSAWSTTSVVTTSC